MTEPVVELTPAGEPGEGDRGRRRYKKAAATAATSLGAKGVTIVVGLVSVPLAIGYLGPERYGAWLTIGSFLAWLNISDLGLGNGLIHALAEAHGKDDRKSAQEHVASAFWILMASALLLTVALAAVFPWVSWERVFQVSSPQARAEVSLAVALALAVFVLQLPLSLVQKIYFAYQEGYIANGWLMAGSIASLAGLIWVTRTEGGLPWLVIAISGAQLLVVLLNTVYLFVRHKPWLRPWLSRVTRASVRKVFSAGVGFLVLQLAGLALLHKDNIIIAQLFGAEKVTPYGVTMRLVFLGGGVQWMLLSSLWPAYGEAAARGDWAWIKRTHRLALAGTVLFMAAFSVGVMLFGRSIIRLWAGEVAVPSVALLSAMVALGVVTAWCQCYSTILYGLGVIKEQALLGLGAGGLSIVLSLGLGTYLGPPGVAWGTVLAIVSVSAWGGPWLLARRLSATKKG